MVKTDEAEKSIANTGKKAETFGSKLKSGIKTAAKWGAAIVAASVAIGGAMIKASKETAATLDTIDKGSQRMKISAESYQELAHAAELSGVSMGTMERAAKALEGTDLNLDDAMNQIMSLGTETERSAKAAELFGEQVAYKMTPLLNSGQEGFEAMKQEAHDLGLVMSQDTVSAGATLNDMFSKVEGSLATLKNSLVADMMPYVMVILQWVIDNIPMIRDTVKTVMDAILPIVQEVLKMIMELLPPLLDAIKKFIDWIMPYLKPILEAITGVVKGVFALIKGDTETFKESIKTLLKTLGTNLLGIGKDIFNALWQGFKAVWTKIREWIGEKVDQVKEKFEGLKDKLKQAAKNAIDGLLGGFKEKWLNISSWVTEKVNWVKDKFSGVSGFLGKLGGSHASGLPYVPYDGYQAVLHRGETVLSAGKTQGMVNDIVNAIDSKIGGGGNAVINLVVDGKTLAQVMYNPLNNLVTQGGVANGR